MNSESVTIKSFEPSDCEEVSTVICRCLREVNIRDYGEDHIRHMLPTFAADNLLRWFEGAEPYVLRVAEKIVATGTVRGQDIQTVFVNPDCRGMGLGKRLMQFLEERVRAKGFREVTLKSSLTSKDFYESLGYRRLCETHGAVGGEMIAMTKQL